jgi:menaquinone-9 beta-reductase
MPHTRFLDAAVTAAARHQDVFDSAIDLGLGRGAASLRDLVRVAGSYLSLR